MKDKKNNIKRMFESLFEGQDFDVLPSSTVIQRANDNVKTDDIVFYHICCEECQAKGLIKEFELQPDGKPHMMLCYAQTCEYCNVYIYGDFYLTTDATNIHTSQGQDI